MQPIKLGLLLDNPKPARWLRLALERTLASGHARLVLVVLNESGARRPTPRFGVDSFDTALYRRYIRWDRRQAVRPEEDALASESIANLLESVPVLRVHPKRKKYSDWFLKEDLDRIRDYQPDVLLRVGFRILRGEVLTVPRFGVWSFHHGDPERYRGGRAGFWETFHGIGMVGCALQRLTEDLDAGVMLARTISPASTASPAVTRNLIYWDSVPLLERCIRSLRETGDPVHPTGRGFEANGPIYRTPGTFTTLRMGLRFLRERVRDNRLRIQHWSIRVKARDPAANPLEFPGGRSRELQAPRGRFWADPSLFEEDGNRWLFFEDFDYSAGRGSIACAPVGGDGQLLEAPRLILDDGHHYSNPLVFRMDGKVWMLPETLDRKQVELYEATDFPHGWVPRHVLIPEVRIVDPVLFRRDDLYWLFGTEVPDGVGSRVSTLKAWHAPAIQGPWTEHSANPLVSDCRRGRAAGLIFQHHGRWIRPAQDGVGGYGRAVRFMEIVDLTPDRYTEREIGILEPSDIDAEGTHAFTFCSDLVVVDARRSRSRRSVGA